ncbi:MAG: hypothetical protein R3B70_18935 [Polyangiaceae bacterium]
MIVQAFVLTCGTAAHLYETSGKLNAPSSAQRAPAPRQRDIVSFLEDAADDLELTIAMLACHEATLDLGVEHAADAIARSEELKSAADALAHMDVAEVFQRAAHRLPPPQPPFHAEEKAALPREELVRFAQARLDIWPHQRAEELAKREHREALAHRCRTALDWLERFVRRNKMPSGEAVKAVKVAGRAYAEGRLTVAEVAALLRCDASDAIATLEEHGFCRSHERAVLPSDTRARMLADLDADRRRRQGAPVVDEALVRRDVLATQRIEGIDARPWMPPK